MTLGELNWLKAQSNFKNIQNLAQAYNRLFGGHVEPAGNHQRDCQLFCVLDFWRKFSAQFDVDFRRQVGPKRGGGGKGFTSKVNLSLLFFFRVLDKM